MDAGNFQQDPLVQDLIRRILDHRDELLTEIRLADSVCYSVTHIRRVFYEAMGESLGDFMRRLRLERAAGMLSLGSRPIVDIALAANYQSSEAFARAFRARFQSPPTLFRALNQGEAHLLPGYVYSTDPSKSSARMEVGLYMSIDRITTYVYDGLTLVIEFDQTRQAGNRSDIPSRKTIIATEGEEVADKTPSAIAPNDLDLACLKERNNFMAIRQGLPPIGATLTNAHGIKWVVDGHTYAPSVMTLGRTGREADSMDLYPVSIPQNLSQKLQDMLQELQACTPKDFVPLDTVPHLRPDQAMPYSHSVDSVSDPNRILLFFDSARIHEAAFAHELAHVWLELVEGIEDYRVLEHLSDSVRYGQVQRIQSFVLDFRVNDLILSRGIDTFELDNDRVKSLEQLSIAASKGYQPPTRWESVAMAMLLAEVFVESTKALTRADEIFAILRGKLPEEWELAEHLAEIVRSEPRSSADSVRQCIDKALLLCFTFAGEHLDLEKDLIERPPNVNWRDKWPGWLSELTPQQKCEVGKAMARSGLGGYACLNPRRLSE